MCGRFVSATPPDQIAVTMHPVSTEVNNVRNNGEQLTQAISSDDT